MVEVKFCGLTRPEDAAVVAELGAHYAGVIFAGGPRLVSVERAREVFAPLRGGAVLRVGVFGAQTPDEIAGLANATGVDVVQLHGGATRESLARLRGAFGGLVWVVVHVAGAALPSSIDGVRTDSDGLVLDAAVPGKLGGTGVTLDWLAITKEVARLRGTTKLVLAGGLQPGNVARAIRLVRPDVVDVSSGVEATTPGIKDPEKMRAFAQAARQTTDGE